MQMYINRIYKNIIKCFIVYAKRLHVIAFLINILRFAFNDINYSTNKVL